VKISRTTRGIRPDDCLPTRVKLGGKFYPNGKDTVCRQERTGKKTKSFLSESIGVGSFLFFIKKKRQKTEEVVIMAKKFNQTDLLGKQRRWRCPECKKLHTQEEAHWFQNGQRGGRQAYCSDDNCKTLLVLVVLFSRRRYVDINTLELVT